MSSFLSIVKLFATKNNISNNEIIEQLTNTSKYSSYPSYIRLLEARTDNTKNSYLRSRSVVHKVEFTVLYMVLHEEVQSYRRKMMILRRNTLLGITEDGKGCRENFRELIKGVIVMAEKLRRLHLATDEELYEIKYRGYKNAIKILLEVFEEYKVYQERMKPKAENANFRQLLRCFGQ